MVYGSLVYAYTRRVRRVREAYTTRTRDMFDACATRVPRVFEARQKTDGRPNSSLAVRATRDESRPMSKKKPMRMAAVLRAKGGPRRSALFRWLLAHYDELSPLLNRKHAPWTDAAAEMATEGIMGANGQPPTPNAPRQVWLRVARDVDQARAEEAARAPKNPVHRSRSDAQWQPPISAPPRRPAAVRQPSPNATAETPPQGERPKMNADVKAKLAAVRRQFAWMDRHIVEPTEEE